MVLDSIENIGLYKGLSENIKKAVEFISTINLHDLAPGKHAILNDEIFVMINEYSTKEEKYCPTETHKKYIDIQIMLAGDEKFGFAAFNNQEVVESYNIEKDYTFYKATLDYQLLREGTFAIFFPSDLHCPGIAINKEAFVKKAVFKVLV